MNTWLHFVGRKYYPTPEKFLSEAEAVGITRRVSLQVMQKMRWNDRVVLAQKKGKTPVVFAQFFIDTLSGITRDAMQVVLNVSPIGDIEVVEEDLEHKEIERGCGMYEITEQYTLKTAANTPLSEIAHALMLAKNSGADIGKPMIGGTCAEELPLTRLKDVPHRQGFRLFDWDEYESAQAAADNGGPRLPVVHGQFYGENTEHYPVCPVKLQAVSDYTRRENIVVQTPAKAIVDQLALFGA